MTRIGLPRGLHFFQYYPLWQTFFDQLGFELVVSPPTNRDLLAAGASLVADVTCLPVKVYAGHVAWLRDHGQVDYVLAPAIRSVSVNALHCAKFQALPDILHATVPNCPPLLDMEVDWHRRKVSLEAAHRRLGQRLGRSWLAVRRAWRAAVTAEAAYLAALVEGQQTYPEVLARLYPGVVEPAQAPAPPSDDEALTVGVVGHPYCLYDDYINHDLLARLRALGVRVLTSEMVAPADAQAGVARTTGQVRWFYEHCMSGAAGHYLHAPQVDGVVAVLAFTCGPDSAMVETITRRAHAAQRACLSLILDEHGSAAGMVTRLEAFVDMLLRQRRTRPAAPVAVTPPAPPPVAAPALLKHSRLPVLGFPSMGTTTIPIKSVFRGIGARLELGPPLSSRTVSLGARYSPEFVCTPYKYILGNMIEMVEAGAEKLLYVDGPELCRNSTYTQLIRDVLRDQGHHVELLTTAILEDKVAGLARFLRQFAPDVSWLTIVREIRLGLAKMFVLDELERRVQWLRPREYTPGTVDKAWEASLLRIDEAADYATLQATRRDCLAKIEATPYDPAAQPVRIATTGEYYAVLEPFFNLDLERELGRLGAEVHRTLMMSHWARGMLILEAMGFPRRPEIDRAAKPYLRWDVTGEAWVTVGQAVIHGQQGFDGLIETLPFTCVPEITALNILPRVSREYNLPIISFIYDEQTGRAGQRTRLEAFVDLLVRRRELKAANGGALNGQAAPAGPVEAVCQACPIAPACQPASGRRPAGCARDAQPALRSAQRS